MKQKKTVFCMHNWWTSAVGPMYAENKSTVVIYAAYLQSFNLMCTFELLCLHSSFINIASGAF